MKRLLIGWLVSFMVTLSIVGLSIAQEKVTIVNMPEPYATGIEMIAKDFQKRLPFIKIEAIGIPYEGLYGKQMTTLMAGSSRYDGIDVLYQWMGAFASYLEPLDDYIKKYNTKMDEFIPGAFEVGCMWEGKTYAFPYPFETMLLFYRKDMLEQAGFSKPPKDYNEFIQIAKKLNDPANDFYGCAIMGQREQAMTVFTDVFWAEGGKLFDENMKPAFNDEKGIEALRKLLTMFKYAPPESVTYALPEAIADFLNGRVAMEEQWPSCITAQAENPKESKVVGRVGYAPVPGGHGHFGGMALGISKYSKHKDATYLFLSYLTSPGNAMKIFEKTGVYPSHVSIYKDPQLAKKYPFFHASLEGLRGTVGRPRIPESTELCDIMDIKVSQVFVGELTPEEALEQCAKEWEQILSDAGYYE